MGWLSRAKSRPTPWRILTSDSCALTAGGIVLGGGAFNEIYVSAHPTLATVTPVGMSGPVVRFRFLVAGLGFGVGVAPVDLSASDIDMPSGGRIYCGEATPRGGHVTLSDLEGPCQVITPSIGAVIGASRTCILFGNGTEPPESSRAIGLMHGTGTQMPGLSLMAYSGYLWRT